MPLLTLTGPAGIGKSALLHALAAQDRELVLVLLDDAPDVDDVAARVHRAVFAPPSLGAAATDVAVLARKNFGFQLSHKLR